MYEYVNKVEFELSTVYEVSELVLFSLIGFFIPFFLGHPQWLVGTIVNFMLVMAALNVKGWKILPLCIAPSLGVFTKGMIFGALTPFLVYMIPFIIASNILLVYTVKYFRHKKMNLLKVVPLTAAIKAVFLVAIAGVFVFFGLVPTMFLVAFGPLQLLTAISGGAVAGGVAKVVKG